MDKQYQKIQEAMAEMYPEFTPKMLYLFMDVVASLGQLPDERRIYLFGIGDEEDMDWVYNIANYIVLEYIKYSFDYSDPEYSLRHFLKKNNADDSERMVQERTLQYVMKYKRRDIAELYPNIPKEEKYANIDMDTMQQKIKGYRMTEMNFFEHNTIHDIDLIKAIIEHRITSSKKISNQRFQEMFEQYDSFVMDLKEKSKNSDEDMVFSALAFFTLEWKYSIETLYFLACLMEEEDLQEVDQSKLVLLCGGVEIISKFGGVFSTESRMVKERFYVLNYLFSKETNQNHVDIMVELIQEVIVLGVLYNEVVALDEDTLYKDWFRKESTVNDWASFFRYYDIFSIWEKKEWTRTRIQNMRKLYSLILRPKE